MGFIPKLHLARKLAFKQTKFDGSLANYQSNVEIDVLSRKVEKLTNASNACHHDMKW